MITSIYVLTRDVGFGLEYFKRIAQVTGQPVAQSTTGDVFRVFTTRNAAEKYHAKWRNIGVGIESYAIKKIPAPNGARP